MSDDAADAGFGKEAGVLLHGSDPADHVNWRVAALQTTLRSSAAVLALAPIVAAVMAGTFRTYLVFLELAGLVLW